MLSAFSLLALSPCWTLSPKLMGALWSLGAPTPAFSLNPSRGFVRWTTPRFCLNSCKALGPSWILSLLPLCSAGGRGTFPAWHTVHLEINHSQVGGTTDRTVRVYFSWDPARFAPCGPFPLPSDLPFTILDPTVYSRRLCSAPPGIRVLPLGVSTVISGPPPVYHGGDLLPSTVTPSTLVACPTIGVDPKVTWGVRRLTRREVLVAHGLSLRISDVLLGSGFSAGTFFTPQNVSITPFWHTNGLLPMRMGHGGGGGDVSAMGSGLLPEPPLKRRLVEIHGQTKRIPSLMPQLGRPQALDHPAPSTTSLSSIERGTQSHQVRWRSGTCPLMDSAAHPDWD